MLSSKTLSWVWMWKLNQVIYFLKEIEMLCDKFLSLDKTFRKYLKFKHFNGIF